MTHAIILAGGFGTRLQGVLRDLPKPMAPISGRPFLEIQMDYLINQGIQSVTLCTGYLSEIIEKHFGKTYRTLSVYYSKEESPLGTGGAIKKALLGVDFQAVVVLNGDSFFGVNLQTMMAHHDAIKSTFTLALKPMKDFDRYGVVLFDEDCRIKKFREKTDTKSGWINGGVYILNSSVAESFPSQAVFAFESFMTDQSSQGTLSAFLSDGYFIDIGIPEDYNLAQSTLPMVADQSFKGWTLFLDRDGVINVRTPGDYVKSLDEWIYCPGALEAIARLSLIFDRIIVVTNQQGVPLGKMSSYALDLIHQNLKDDVRKSGGYIDAIYASTDLKEKVENSRKPNEAMGHWAKRDFSNIDFHRSIMVGDSASDIAFGKALNMRTVCIAGKFEDTEDINKLKPNWKLPDLAHFAAIFSNPSSVFKTIDKGQPFEL